MNPVIHTFYRTFAGPLAALVFVHAVGTIGYRLIGGTQYSLIDCFYMTFVTITTMGYRSGCRRVCRDG